MLLVNIRLIFRLNKKRCGHDSEDYEHNGWFYFGNYFNLSGPVLGLDRKGVGTGSEDDVCNAGGGMFVNLSQRLRFN